MADLALGENGAEVLVATSMENRHPPSHIIDGDPGTFWISTGLYPQDLIISLSTPSLITEIEIRCRSVREMVIERCETPQPINFLVIDQICLDNSDEGDLQHYHKEFKATAARYLKIHIVSAYDDLVAVHTVKAAGRPY